MPERRWQRVQWQYDALSGGAPSSKRTPPQRHPPVRGDSCISFEPKRGADERIGRLLGREPAVGEYEYELRRDGAVIATGRIQLDEPPSPGDELSLGSTHALVEDVLPQIRGRQRLILQTS